MLWLRRDVKQACLLGILDQPIVPSLAPYKVSELLDYATVCTNPFLTDQC